MCGRFTLHHTTAEIAERFDVEPAPSLFVPRYNIAPTQPVVAIVNLDGARSIQRFAWGLVPSWATDPKIGSKMINARAETIAGKPSFKRAFAARRCLIPADGFFEWRRDGAKKSPMHIRLRTGGLFALAGIWESWRDPGGQILRTCSVITVEPNSMVASIHDRMPAILVPQAEALWLDAAYTKPDDLLPWLGPYPAEEMEAFPVSRSVNSPAFDDATCIEPVDPDE